MSHDNNKAFYEQVSGESFIFGPRNNQPKPSSGHMEP
jgi:hypothetical protein